MPIGYKYESSGDAGYVNWAAVTKGFVDVLNADIKDKRKREEEYAAQDRKISQTLSEVPLGKFEDGNTFTNNFVDAMTNQRLIDYKLFKAGKLSEKAYRLKTNNAIDGTKTIFDLQKKFQEESEDRMKGLQDGTYMPLTASNMSLIEGFKDFKDSVPIVDPATGLVNIAKKKYDKEKGTWDIEYGKTMPVNMAMNLIMTPVKTYDINGAINKDMEQVGTLADAIYEAASTKSQSVITSIEGGVEVLKDYPDAAGVVKNFNEAIDGKVSEYLSNTLQLASVLSVNTGKYNAESFIYDKDQAAKDPTKILMKIDPTSKFPVMDETAPHFEEQKEQAAKWVKTQMLSKINRSRKIDAGGQLSDQTYHASAAEIEAGKQKTSNAETGEMIAALYSGSDEDVAAAMSYFKGLDYVDDMGRLDNGEGFWVDLKDDAGNITRKNIDFTANDKEIGVENAVKAGTKLFLGNAADTTQSLKRIGKYKKQKRNTTYAVAQEEARNDYSPEVKAYVASVPKGSIIKGDDTIDSVGRLTDAYGDLGFTFEKKEKGIVKVVSLDSKGNAVATQDFNIFKSNGDAAPGIETQINNWIIAHHDAETARKKLAPTMKNEKGKEVPTMPVGTKTKAKAKGGGVGSKYN